MDRTVPDGGGAADNKLSSDELRRKKTSFTLDFGSATREPVVSAKKPKQDFRDGILGSPDVGLLALATPDLERFIIQQAYGAAAAATTPPGAAAASIVTTPTQVLFPRSVTEEQEAYARGFLDALLELHRQQQQQQAAASPLLQVVPDPRTGILLPRVSPSDEGQNSLYSNLTPSTRLPPPAATVSMDAAAMAKRIIPEFPTATVVPFSGSRPTSLDLSPAARRSAILPSFGIKRFPPFVDDCETLDLSPSGRFANRSLATAASQKATTNSATLLSACTVVHQQSEAVHAFTGDMPQQILTPVHNDKLQDTLNDQHSCESSSRDTVSDAKDQPASQVERPADFSGALLPTRPIDMSVQELAKLERKREKNRHAAQKCRLLKLERISRLQQRVDELKQQNEQFAGTAGSLRDHVGKLRQLIVEHVESGCQVMMVRSMNAS